MAYILYSVLFFFIAGSTLLYFTRSRWTPFLPDRVQDALYSLHPSNFTYSRVPTSFIGDVEGGFTSNNFDLSSNVMEGDSRGGLDQNAKREVQRLMKIRGLNFDEARRVYMEQRFKKNGIGADGIPRDPKFVSFS